MWEEKWQPDTLFVVLNIPPVRCDFPILAMRAILEWTPGRPWRQSDGEELSRTLKISKGKYTRVPFIKRPGAAAEYSDTGCYWILQTRSGCKVHCPIFTQALRDAGGAPCFINGRTQPTFALRTSQRWEEISTGLKRFKVTFINRILQICTSFWLEMRHHLLNTTQAVQHNAKGGMSFII